MNRLHFSPNAAPDDATVKNMTRLNAFSDAQLSSLTRLVLDFLQSRHTGASFVALADEWAEQQSGTFVIV